MFSNMMRKYHEIRFSFILLSYLITNVDCQYETSNDVCGGFFKSIRGSINFYFNETTTNTTDQNKICFWTVTPVPGFRYFMINEFEYPQNLSCDQYSITISTFSEWSEEHSTMKFCGGNQTNLPLRVNGPVMTIALFTTNISLSSSPSERFYMSFDKEKWEDQTNITRMVQNSYSWGRPTLKPLPYTGEYFLSNSLTTLAFVKANYSDGSNYEFRFELRKVEIGPNIDCFRDDFLMVLNIENDGQLTKQHVYKESMNSTEIYKSGYGNFIIFWGGVCGVGGGGGSMIYYYNSVRIA